MKNVLVVFSGKARSGKSESSKIIKSLYKNTKYKVKIWSFAKELKILAKSLLGWDGDKTTYYLSNGDLDTSKGRGLLISFGQKMREVKETVWVDFTMKKIYKSEKNKKAIIHCIDDARFRNEINIIKQYSNCIIIRIKKESSLNINDVSENDLDNEKFDLYIENNGTKKELKNQLKKIVGNILCQD